MQNVYKENFDGTAKGIDAFINGTEAEGNPTVKDAKGVSKYTTALSIMNKH